MNNNLKSKNKISERNNERRIKISSKGKRLFSFLLDFIFSLLFVNTISQVFRKQHCDLSLKSQDFQELFPFYGSVLLLLIFKDIFGNSLGKFLLGMKIVSIKHLSKPPSIYVLITRNFFLVIAPIEGIILLSDGYARRFADKWHETVVVDKENSIRPIMRIFLGNIILFGFFSIAIFFQRSSIEKSAAYQKAIEGIRNHTVLKGILEKYPLIEELEMNLDLSLEKRKDSIVSLRIGKEEQGKSIKVFLKLQNNLKNWEVVDILVKSSINNSN